MSSNVYILGKSIDEFENYLSTDTHLFALRRNDDGDLFLLKTRLKDSSSVTLFGENIPQQFQSMEIPSDDYFEGRAADHVLQFDADEVKYEQWKWVDRVQSYYLDRDGNFILSIGEDKQLPRVEDIQITPNHVQSFDIIGDKYDVNLYDLLLDMGWNGVSEVIVDIEGNIRATDTSKAALVIDNEFVNGITIYNNGNIIGCNGSLINNPANNRNLGLAISVETPVVEFINQGVIRAGSFNNSYANAFRGFSNIDNYTNNNGIWIGHDD